MPHFLDITYVDITVEQITAHQRRQTMTEGARDAMQIASSDPSNKPLQAITFLIVGVTGFLWLLGLSVLFVLASIPLAVVASVAGVAWWWGPVASAGFISGVVWLFHRAETPPMQRDR